MNKSVIVYGPSGCGKTRHAEHIRKHFGLDCVVDDFDAIRLEKDLCGVLYLTSDMRTPFARKFEVENGTVFSFAEVAQQINAAIPLTDWQSGPPPAVGEWNASTTRDESCRRWWDGSTWSMAFDLNCGEAIRDNRAGMKCPWDSADVQWRGLAEEPIVVVA